MNRTRGLLVLLVVLGVGTATALGGPYMSQYWNKGTPDGVHWGPSYAPEVQAVQGPWGEPVPVVAPYNVKPPTGADAARAMLGQSMPLDLLQQAGYFKNGGSVPIMQVAAPGGCPGGMCPPTLGAPGAPISPPGISGVPPGALPPGLRPPGAVAAVGALAGPAPSPFPIQRTEVRFVGPPGMKISWYGPTADGRGAFGPQFLEAPARYNFLQASIYRLKLSDIPNRPGVELYPTLEVVPAKAKTCTFLAHSAVPIAFTEEDFDQVAAGNFVVKVIYLPDPQFQDLAAAGGPDEVVSSRLQPGVDPIVEAQRRGCILLVVRLGNIDLEAPNTPAMDAPNPFQPHVAHPPAIPGMAPMPGIPLALGQMGQMMPGQMIPGQGMPGQGAAGMAARPQMTPYGNMNGRPLLPGTPDMQTNPNRPPPGMMLPPAGTPGMFPTGTRFPGEMSAPGTPLSQLPSPAAVQPAANPAMPAAPQMVRQPPPRQPTTAELAGQLSTWVPPSTPPTGPGPR